MRQGKNTWLTPGRVTAAIILLVLCFGVMVREAKAPGVEDDIRARETQPPVRDASETGQRVQADCEVIQTMAFTRCGHSITRRIQAPQQVAGMDFSAAQAYYDLWQFSSFSPDRMDMRREIPLFCPMHQVLAVNEAGEVVLTNNRYGDGMAVEKTYALTLKNFDEETQASLRLGLGFDSVEEAEAWLGLH